MRPPVPPVVTMLLATVPETFEKVMGAVFPVTKVMLPLPCAPFTVIVVAPVWPPPAPVPVALINRPPLKLLPALLKLTSALPDRVMEPAPRPMAPPYVLLPELFATMERLELLEEVMVPPVPVSRELEPPEPCIVVLAEMVMVPLSNTLEVLARIVAVLVTLIAFENVVELPVPVENVKLPPVRLSVLLLSDVGAPLPICKVPALMLVVPV